MRQIELRQAIVEGNPTRMPLLNWATECTANGQHLLAQACLAELRHTDSGNSLLHLREVGLIPHVIDSPQVAESFRRSILESVKALQADGFAFDPADLLPCNANPSFHLTYLGFNDRAIKEAYAMLFESRVAPLEPPRPRTGEPAIGVVVTRSHEGVFIRCFGGILRHFQSGLAKITVYCDELAIKKLQRAIANPDVELVALPYELDAASRVLRSAGLDLIYYFEVNSDPLNYFLPMFRCAPVQVTSFGVQATSGMQSVTHYLSSRYIEPDNAQEHYTERLTLIDSLFSHLPRPQPPWAMPNRADYGIPERCHTYVCAQNILKIHPDLDPIFLRILEGDPSGVLVLLASEHVAITEALRSRLIRSLGVAACRAILVPPMTRETYMGLLSLADVVLDPIHFSGFNTSYDALGLNLPVVTLPGPWQKARTTYAFYKRMGIDDCIVHSPDEYSQLAIRLGTDRDFRRHTSRRIAATSGILFNDMTCVREHERVFLELIGEARSRG
jgi:hypothetical protein